MYLSFKRGVTLINANMERLGKKSSIIREIFEYGKKRKSEIGEENVFDFSLGNPSIPCPDKVNETIISLLKSNDAVSIHGYTSASGDYSVKSKIAESINRRFSVAAKPENIYITCGAAASLTITLKAVANPEDEVIILAPFFPEYKVFTENCGAIPVVVKCRQSDFQIDFEALKAAINNKTKAIIINSPNNPSGAVFPEDDIKKLSKILSEKDKEYGTEIFIIADEPYRELSYGLDVPYIPKFYHNTIVCYSYSKSLSLPGERIGYIFVSPNADASSDISAAVAGAGRSLGFVCAPSLMQYTIKECVDITSDISAYKANRDLLYTALKDYGYSAIRPDGAFYLFVKSPEPNAVAFCERAKKYELLLVPSDDFGVEGYVRISYCVSAEQIKRSLPAFKKLIEERI